MPRPRGRPKTKRKSEYIDSNKSRRCYLCGHSFMGGHVHYLRLGNCSQEAIDILRAWHVQQSQQTHFSGLVTSHGAMKICCRHFLPSHSRIIRGKTAHWALISDRSCLRAHLPERLPIDCASLPSPYQNTRKSIGELNPSQTPRKSRKKTRKESETADRHAYLRMSRSVGTRRTGPSASALKHFSGSVVCKDESLNAIQSALFRSGTLDCAEVKRALTDAQNQHQGDEEVLSLLRSMEMILERAKDTAMVREMQLERDYCRYNWYSIVKRDEFHTWTGFSDLEAFERHFVRPIEPHWNEQTTYSYTLRDAVLWLFMYMNTGWSLKRLTAMLGHATLPGISRQGVTKLLKRVAKHLGDYSRTQVTLPLCEEWKSRYNLAIGGEETYMQKRQLVLLLDGTSIKVMKPKDFSFSRLTWCNYKRMHCWRMFIACTLSGHIVYASSVTSGRETDDALFRKSGLGERLEAQYATDVAEGDHAFFLGGDKGYVDTQPPVGWDLVVTKSGENELRQRTNQTIPDLDDGADPRNVPVSPGPSSFTRHFSSEFASARSVVEIAIRHMKGRFPLLCAGQLRVGQHEDMLNDMLQIAAFVANMTMDRHFTAPPTPSR